MRRLSVSAEQQVFVGMQPVALTHTHTHTTIRTGLTHVTANLTRSNAERRTLQTILIHLSTRPNSDWGDQTAGSHHQGQVCVRMLQDHPINAPQSRVYRRRYMTSAINVINASKFTLAAPTNKATEVTRIFLHFSPASFL